MPELALDQEDLSPHLALSTESPNSSAMDMFLVTLLPGLVPNSPVSDVETGGEQGDSRTVLALPFLQPNSLSVRLRAWGSEPHCGPCCRQAGQVQAPRFAREVLLIPGGSDRGLFLERLDSTP